MENLKSNEVTSIRSNALIVLFSMVISALILLPLLSSAKGADKSKTAKVYIRPLSNKSSAAVTVSSVDQGNFTLIIESENGMDIYYDKVMKSPENFSKVFDFSNLQDGEYTLKMKSNGETKELGFSITDGKILVNNNEKAEAIFNMNGEKATITVPNAANQVFSILIVDENGNELYSAVESATEIKKVFDFSTVAAGKYQILASSNGHSYAYDFEKKK